MPAEEIIALYAKRFTNEENLRDEKDWRFGLGALCVDIERTDRRDKMCQVISIAVVLLTLLGHAGEQLGLARALRANTAKIRTHSLFRQGHGYFRGAVGKLSDAVDRLWNSFWGLRPYSPQRQQNWVSYEGMRQQRPSNEPNQRTNHREWE